MLNRKNDISQFSLLDGVRRGDVTKSDYTGDDARGNKMIRLLAVGQGFDAKPNVVSASEMKMIEKTGEYFIASRGVKDVLFAEQFKIGDMFFGKNGAFGDGIYSALQTDKTDDYIETALVYSGRY
jgi:hypothetical protein